MHNVLKIVKGSLLNFKLVRKSIKDYNYSNLDNYYNFNGFILSYIITGNCYFLYKDNERYGIILINNIKCQINFIPFDIASLNREDYLSLINLLDTDFNIKGYTIILKLKDDFDIDKYQTFYQFKFIQNIRFMSLDFHNAKVEPFVLSDKIKVNTLNMNYNGEEKRVLLQNKIFQFENARGRTDLTIEEVYIEESSSGFIKDLCFTLDFSFNSIGYGQVILIKQRHFLVNFGIIPEYQRRGLGHIFLNGIINQCISYGIKRLCLTVDNNNLSAVKLYKSSGFKDEYTIYVLECN